MRLRFDQLAGQLRRQLVPIYLICGEEPWQLGEAVRMVRAHALGQGFEREVLDQDANFDWPALAAAADALSLFASRRLIELRLGAATLGQEGSAAVRRYCERVTPDRVLVMVAPKLDRKDLKTKWAQELERVGALVQVWPLEGGRLIAWLGDRLGAAGFQPAPGVAALLAERVEGNLLAAVQEIEKLRLLREPGPLDEADREAPAFARAGSTGRGGSARRHLRQRPLRPLRPHRCRLAGGPGSGGAGPGRLGG
jgi:DNA polymerase III subunit delta